MPIDKNKILGTLKKVGEQASQVVGDIRDNTKLSFDIAGKESELSDLYRELGKATYEMSKNNITGMTPNALMAVIDAKNEELEELKARKVELNSPSVCPHCGRDLASNVMYCPMCGAKIETVGDTVKEAASDIKEAARDVVDDIKETAGEVKEDIADAVSDVRDTMADAASEIRETFSEAGDKIKDHFDD